MYLARSGDQTKRPKARNEDAFMIHVIAIITTKLGKRAEVLEAFHANVPAVKAEKGCMEYGPVVDAADMGPIQTPFGEDTFVVIEKWETKDDLKAHAAAPHMAAYAAKVKNLLASRVIHVMTDA
jgi:quinol monooxygenase YgiN